MVTGSGSVVVGPALGLRTGGAVTGVWRAAVCSFGRLWLGTDRRSSAIPTAATATATAAAASTTPVIDGRRPKWRVARRSLSRRGEPPPSLPALPRAGERSSKWNTCGWTTGTGLVGSSERPGSASPFSPDKSQLRRQTWQGGLGGLMAGQRGRCPGAPGRCAVPGHPANARDWPTWRRRPWPRAKGLSGRGAEKAKG